MWGIQYSNNNNNQSLVRKQEQKQQTLTQIYSYSNDNYNNNKQSQQTNNTQVVNGWKKLLPNNGMNSKKTSTKKIKNGKLCNICHSYDNAFQCDVCQIYFKPH